MAVRKTKRGLWKAVVFVRREVGPNGESHRKDISKCFRLKADADRWVREQTDRRDRGTLRPGKMTLDAFFQLWQAKWRGMSAESRERRSRTQDQYERLYAVHWRPSLGAVRLDRIARRDVQNVVDFIREQCGGRTAQYALAVLHKIFNDAVQGDLLALNPATKVVVGRREERQARTLSPDEVYRLLSTAELKESELVAAEIILNDRARPLVAALWCVLAYTGVRPSEALGLRWDDIDLEQAALYVRHTLVWNGRASVLTPSGRWSLEAPKTARSKRSIQLVEPVLEALARHRKRQTRRIELIKARAGSEAYAGHHFVFATHTG